MLLSKTKPNCVRLPVVGKQKAFGGDEAKEKQKHQHVVLTYVNESVMSLSNHERINSRLRICPFTLCLFDKFTAQCERKNLWFNGSEATQLK